MVALRVCGSLGKAAGQRGESRDVALAGQAFGFQLPGNPGKFVFLPLDRLLQTAHVEPSAKNGRRDQQIRRCLDPELCCTECCEGGQHLLIRSRTVLSGCSKA